MAVVDEKAVFFFDMLRKILQKFAVGVKKRAAFYAFQMKVLARLAADILKARLAAVARDIAADASRLAQPIERPINRRKPDGRAVFLQRAADLLGGHMPARTHKKRFDAGFLLGVVAFVRHGTSFSLCF